MAKKKYYAVKEGKVPGIYSTWDECKIQVDGFSGAKYKSFPSLDAAEHYMSNDTTPVTSSDEEKKESQMPVQDVNKMVDDKINALKEDESLAFVDGSFDEKAEKAGFGVIIISHGGVKDTLYKSITKNLDEDFIKLRNVAAELEGVKEAVNWAIKYNKRKITIFYDYTGIEEWANGSWRAKTNITKKYVSFVNEKKKYIEIEYVKVSAHSGVIYNEEADALAKSSLLAKGHKTYNDGSVYFVGYSVDDWKTIVDIINEENLELTNEDIEKIELSVENIGNRDRVVITHLGSRVVVNCYSNFNSYAQGKQSVLFQKIIVTAIGLLKDGHSAVETLNNYHALTIRQAEVENNFERLLPHYTGSRNDKNYINLLSAVYNTMLTGYMPDYTCLVTPIFRAYEYYLHKILGEKIGLNTARDNGTNNFAYFDKDASGKYFCNSNDVDKLNEVQRDFLNELYNSYNSVRHAYSHWSADDYDTAVITEMGPARELIEKGIALINKYYILFES